MPADRDRSQVLHLIDLDEGTDPLAGLVVDGRSAILRGHFEDPVLRWRAAAQLLRDRPRFTVAWGEPAFDVARQGGVLAGIYRPTDLSRPQMPSPGWRAAVSTRAELQRFADYGWSESDCLIVPPPGVDATQRCCGRRLPTRNDLGVVGDDFVWLLTGDAGPGSGLREAIWAGALMHVMERDHRLHRIVLWGDRRAQHRARRFADHLGLPALPIRASNCSYHALAQIVDAALLLPRGSDAWSAAVIAHSGLPAVVNRNATVQEVLGSRSNVRTSPGDRTRLVVREMLALAEGGAARLPGDASFAPQRVRGIWDQALVATLSAVSGRER